MPFKGMSCLELWQPFCSMERNYLCNVGGRYYEKRYNEIILNFGSVVQEEMSSKIFLIYSYCGPPFQWSETIYAFLKEGIMRNIHVKLYEIKTSGSGGDVF